MRSAVYLRKLRIRNPHGKSVSPLPRSMGLIVHRDNYLNSLRRATRDNDFSMYSKIMDQAQAYTMSIPWHDYSEAREKIENDYADKSPDEGLPIFNRVLRKLILSEF